MKIEPAILLSLILPAVANPFGGGNGSGHASVRHTGYLDGSASIFGGGSGDGHDRDRVAAPLGTGDLLDSDGDGMPDLYEILNSLNPTVADGDLDADRDGSTNYAEYLFCTDPQDPADFTRVSLFMGGGNTTVNLLWQGVSGKRYEVYSSPDLENWVLRREVVSGADGPQATSVLTNGQGKLFFKLQVNQ